MNLVKSTGTFGFFTIISRLLGYIRDFLIAIFLGTGVLADVFFVAFRIPNTFRRLFSEGTFNAAFVPSYSSEILKGKKNSNKFDTVIQKLTNTSTIKAVSEKVDGASFRVKSNEYFVPISIENIDIEAEINKLEGELKRAEGFLFGITKKLSNERFVANAPEQVITLERKKEADTKAKIETIKSSLKSLK